MLAAGSAWRILEAEHTQLRQIMADIARMLDDGAWKRPGPRLDSLRGLIHKFQDFETRTHRPKGVVLLGATRGRLPEADRLLDVLEHDGQRCEELLNQALDLLRAVEAGGEAEAGGVATLLREHRELMTLQLDQEDTALRAYTAQLLTSEEWSRVVSSISREVRNVKGRPSGK
jgi:hemerythrin-like domain-containing protein